MSQKKALVTGASEGIGREFALRLASEGFAVTAVARNAPRLADLTMGLGDGHSAQVADLSTPDGVGRIASELESRHYDLLVNNAGFGIYGRFHETPLPSLAEMTRLNCEALVALSHAFLKVAQKGDALINLSSVLAFAPMPSLGLYSATKAFVTSFSESLWFEQKPRGVYVMGLCPGLTTTQFQKRSGGRVGKLAAALAQTPAQVVDTALKALSRREDPTVISGAKNKVLAACLRLQTRKAAVERMG